MTFEDTCKFCLECKELVREWNRLTGHKLRVSRSPIIMAIDRACGYDPHTEAMAEFVDFVYEFIWLPLAERED
jgi:hypothetical protein